MKPNPIVIALLFLVATAWQHAAVRRAAEASFVPGPGHEVVLLATSWCGYCSQARAYLSRNGVAFEEHDVERSESGSRLWGTLGRPGVPVVLVDGRPIFGFDPRAMRLALAQPEASQ